MFHIDIDVNGDGGTVIDYLIILPNDAAVTCICAIIVEC